MSNINRESSSQNKISVLVRISFTVSLIIFIFILNWIFKITPYQKLEGLSLVLAQPIGFIGMVLSVFSMRIRPNRLAKCSIIFNVILIVFPYLYWTLGYICGF